MGHRKFIYRNHFLGSWSSLGNERKHRGFAFPPQFLYIELHGQYCDAFTNNQKSIFSSSPGRESPAAVPRTLLGQQPVRLMKEARWISEVDSFLVCSIFQLSDSGNMNISRVGFLCGKDINLDRMGYVAQTRGKIYHTARDDYEEWHQ
jgi:hypothetical protein